MPGLQNAVGAEKRTQARALFFSRGGVERSDAVVDPAAEAADVIEVGPSRELPRLPAAPSSAPASNTTDPSRTLPVLKTQPGGGTSPSGTSTAVANRGLLNNESNGPSYSGPSGYSGPAAGGPSGPNAPSGAAGIDLTDFDFTNALGTGLFDNIAVDLMTGGFIGMGANFVSRGYTGKGLLSNIADMTGLGNIDLDFQTGFAPNTKQVDNGIGGFDTVDMTIAEINEFNESMTDPATHAGTGEFSIDEEGNWSYSSVGPTSEPNTGYNDQVGPTEGFDDGTGDQDAAAAAGAAADAAAAAAGAAAGVEDAGVGNDSSEGSGGGGGGSGGGGSGGSGGGGSGGGGSGSSSDNEDPGDTDSGAG